jgi:hypothetical protein
MAIFITPPNRRNSGWPSRWTLKPAGSRTKPEKDRDYHGRFVGKDPPTPERFKSKKKGWW